MSSAVITFVVFGWVAPACFEKRLLRGKRDFQPNGTQVTPPLLQQSRNFSELSTLAEPIVIRAK